MPEEKTISERFSAGVTALDEVYGENWPLDINLDVFESIQSGYGCLLDQLYGSYSAGERVMEDWRGPVYYNDHLMDSFCADDRSIPGEESEAVKLTEAYRRFIESYKHLYG